MNADNGHGPQCDGPRLTQAQRGQILFAQHDLDEARSTDLASLTPTDLILLVERLRGRLDDVLRILAETCP